MIVTVLIFIAVLSILVLVHEFGHFITAKKAGAKVEEFGLGFPPRAFGIKRGETIYSINFLPFGGFVRIQGEDGSDRSDPKSFASKGILTRAFIVAAGVLMNLLLAVVLFSFAHAMGIVREVDEDNIPANAKNVGVLINFVDKDSPAHGGEIRPGDVILSMESEGERIDDIRSIQTVQDFTSMHLGKEVAIGLKRGGDVLEKTIIPRASPPEGEGAIGISMTYAGTISQPLYLAPIKGIESTAMFTIATFQAFGDMAYKFFVTGSLQEEVAGPVGIAVLTGEVRQLGFVFLMQFMALISINLAIINIFPFPALDGGRLLFFLVEAIKGSPVNQKYEKMAHTVGFFILIALIILITARDVGKFL